MTGSENVPADLVGACSLGRRRDRRTGTSRLIVGLVVGVVAATTVAACSSSATKGSTSSSASSSTSASSTAVTSSGSYAASVNKLCDDLIPKVLAIRTGPAGSEPTLQEFLAEDPKLEPVYKAFDAQVDALPVSTADKPADAAFDAYRTWLSTWNAQLQAAAGTGDVSKFKDALARLDRDFKTAKEVSDLHTAGIECPAR
jgi:hypothetical protein